MVARTPALPWSPDQSGSSSSSYFDALSPLASDERLRLRQAYYEHVLARDGEIDFEAGALPVRDERIRRLLDDPIEWDGRLDVDGFYRHLHRIDTPELDPTTLWALGIAVCSESERFGVETERKMLLKKGIGRVDPVHLYHVLQEDYHSVLLDKACSTLGLRGVTFQLPGLFKRTIIRTQVHMPDRIRYALILVGEVIGCVVLQHLRDTCARYVDDEAVAEHLHALLDEILHDEQLHALHCRSRLGRGGIALARTVLSSAVRAVRKEYPAFAALGLDDESLLAQVREGIAIPADVEWIRPDGGSVR